MDKNKGFQAISKAFNVLFFPIVGLLAIIWFMVRVIPKPSRITYPCQQMAASFGSSYLAYIAAALFGGSLIFHIKKQIVRRRAELFLVIVVVSALSLFFLNSEIAPTNQALTTIDPPNQPIGTAKGIFPGRVAWYYDTAVTRWDGSTGFWWDDTNTDQRIVNEMLAGSIITIGGKVNLFDSWQEIFKDYNLNHGMGNKGYSAGEKIVIKINGNQDSKQTWDNGGFQSPHVVYALVSQLVETVGVNGSDITLAEPSRYIGDPIYNKIRSNPNQHFQAVTFIVKPNLSGNGRVGATADSSKPIHFEEPYPNDPNIRIHYPPLCYTEATYLINLGLLRSHTLFGITVGAKNYFGSVYNGSTWSPSPLHGSGTAYNPPNEIGNPHCHPVLIGHNQLGGKTLLYMLDGLYTAVHQGSKDIVKWQTLNNDWCSSLLVSQDPVALDSVALDFLRNEPNMQTTALNQHVCNYLHEAALAHDPPSGVVYDPEDDGIPLNSLGTHEHWNNAIDRQYSRNLGTGDGIELVSINPYLTINSPNGGELLNKGRFYSITWDSENIISPLKITLWKDDVLMGLIAGNVDASTKNFLWLVGKYIGGAAPVGQGYKIKIKGQGFSKFDSSDNTFDLIRLNLLNPVGGEVLKMSSNATITWKAKGYTGTLKIILFKDGAVQGAIARNVPVDSMVYSWIVGDYIGGKAATGTGYQIVLKVKGLSISDYNYSPFTIVD
jgi:hypothetical protein